MNYKVFLYFGVAALIAGAGIYWSLQAQGEDPNWQPPPRIDNPDFEQGPPPADAPDGSIPPGQMGRRQMQGQFGRPSGGALSVSAVGKSLYVLQGNVLIRFNTDTLEEAKRVSLPTPKAESNNGNNANPPAPGQGRPPMPQGPRMAVVTATAEYVFVFEGNNIHKFKADTLALISTKPMPAPNATAQ